jgi:hypothetical protein
VNLHGKNVGEEKGGNQLVGLKKTPTVGELQRQRNPSKGSREGLGTRVTGIDSRQSFSEMAI